ncbi:hypothetical protein GALMADRAFT_134507 [Galerina marginata CBS 339.88]|uniref:Uncharacterized protein n=1 Tax=Galerina marginata (strain CBS 339.88) TaxID=685588 RepID=A0A067TIP6_GALM3|nr:hypothetical protein GALMADRAFT_134507 [Galerina marginata CBS 339.88]
MRQLGDHENSQVPLSAPLPQLINHQLMGQLQMNIGHGQNIQGDTHMELQQRTNNSHGHPTFEWYPDPIAICRTGDSRTSNQLSRCSSADPARAPQPSIQMGNNTLMTSVYVVDVPLLAGLQNMLEELKNSIRQQQQQIEELRDENGRLREHDQIGETTKERPKELQTTFCNMFFCVSTDINKTN